MSFMAVAYIPAYLEDLSLFKKERANGLYGPIAFMVSNFITGLPFLCKSPLHDITHTSSPLMDHVQS